MKKLCKLIIAALFFAGVLALLPVGAQAANTTRTLQPGRVYTFTGLDARVISHITVTGTTRYQYVALNGRGDVTGYGFSVGRVSVNGNGQTLITPSAPMQVTFNSARLTVRHEQGEALRQLTVNEGQTLLLENTGRTNQHIRTNRAAYFDIVATNAAGSIAAMNREVRFPQFNLPSNGHAVLTATDSNMVVYFPNIWHGGIVRTSYSTDPAIVARDVWEGVPFILSHGEERTLAVDFAPHFTTAAFTYEFITRDQLGFSVAHGETSGNRVSIPPERSVTITPLMDAEMFFPAEVARSLTISEGTDAPAHYLLEPGDTLIISNTHTIRPFDVYLSSEPGGYGISYDFALESEDDFSFGIRQSAGRIAIPPGGTLTLTAGEPPEWMPQTLAVRFAYNEYINYRVGTTPVLRHTLTSSEGLIITNTNENRTYTVFLTNDLGNNALLYDYTLETEHDFILRIDQTAPQIAIPPGGVLTLTAGTPPEGAAQRIVVHSARRTALTHRIGATPVVRHILNTNSGLVINNTDENRAYNVLITNIGRGNTVSYDYTLETDDDFILRTNQNAAQITIPPGGILTLAAGIPPQGTTQTLAVHMARRAAVTHHVDTAPVVRYALDTDKGLVISNLNSTRTYSVFITNTGRSNAVLYDFTLETEDDFVLRTNQSAAQVNIPPGGILTLAAGMPPEGTPQTLAAHFACRETITHHVGTSPVVRYALAPGDSAIFHNTSDEPLALQLLSDYQNAALDFLRFNKYGDVVDFGLQRAARPVIEPDKRTHFTNASEYEFVFIFPAVWLDEGLEISNAATPALFRRTLEEGEWLRFENTSTLTPITLLVTEAFDFALTDNENRLISYGIQNGGNFTLQQRERVTIMPSDEALDVLFPFIWQPRIVRMATVANPPLFHIHVSPNETITLRNPLSTAATLPNNSQRDGAGYYIRDGIHDTAIPTSGTHSPVYGRDIVLGASRVYTLTARGATLHIWMPFALARQLRLV
jgi:hypothetical protein